MYYKISHGSVTLGNNTVLEDINFCVKDNEKIGIVGRNGCGKTTLLKAIVGEYEITSGYEEVDIISSEDFNIGYVKQNDGYSLDMKMIDWRWEWGPLERNYYAHGSCEEGKGNKVRWIRGCFSSAGTRQLILVL